MSDSDKLAAAEAADAKRTQDEATKSTEASDDGSDAEFDDAEDNAEVSAEDTTATAIPAASDEKADTTTGATTQADAPSKAASRTSVTSPGPTASLSEPLRSRLGGGVASLMKRFGGGSASASPVEEKSPAQVQEEEEKAAEEAAAAALEDDKVKLSPSIGATSLLDPQGAILRNPFAPAAAPSSDAGEAEAPGTVTPRRFSEAEPVATDASRAGPSQHLSSISSEGSDAGDARSSSIPGAGARFSLVSLGSTATGTNGSRGTVLGSASGSRNSSSTTAGLAEPASATAASTEFISRQHARLSMDNAKRSHSRNASEANAAGAAAGATAAESGVAKLKENFERLHAKDEERRRSGSLKGKDRAAAADALEGRSRAAEGDEGQASAQPSHADYVRQSTFGVEHWDGPPAEDLGEESIDWDFWGTVMSNYQEIARSHPRELSRAIQAGIPGALRGMMWQLMSSSKDEEMEIIYAYYLKQTSSHEKNIRKDLARTFPEQEYFKDGKGIGQENLYNVIKAYSLYDEECGYCQGMQFVVGPLLLNMPDEEAFSTLVRLMKSYDLRGHFIPNMPSLQLRLFQFDRLLEEMLPLLYRHLTRQGIKSTMYASSWLMTLFCHRTPLDIVFRILDSVFAEGIEALFRFAITLMRKNEERLLELSFEDAVPLLAMKMFDVYKRSPEELEGADETTPGAKPPYRVNEFVRDAFQTKITPFMLDQYAAEFDEQVKAANAHRIEVQALRLMNRNLTAKVKELESQLTQVNAEHVDLVKSVVMAKLAREEMAEELVRYKMMFAEASLAADERHLSVSSSASNSLSRHGQSSSARASGGGGTEASPGRSPIRRSASGGHNGAPASPRGMSPSPSMQSQGLSAAR